MGGIIKFIEDRRVLMACTILSVVLIMAFQELTQRLGGPMFDTLQGGYDLMALRELMLVYGADGRASYALASITLDAVFPFVYGTLAIGLLLRLAAFPILRLLAILPVFVMAFDLAENVQLYFLLSGFPEITEAAVLAASEATQMKSLAVLAALLALAFQLSLRLVLVIYQQVSRS